jgi:hypothetical protein
MYQGPEVPATVVVLNLAQGLFGDLVSEEPLCQNPRYLRFVSQSNTLVVACMHEAGVASSTITLNLVTDVITQVLTGQDCYQPNALERNDATGDVFVACGYQGVLRLSTTGSLLTNITSPLCKNPIALTYRPGNHELLVLCAEVAPILSAISLVDFSLMEVVPLEPQDSMFGPSSMAQMISGDGSTVIVISAAESGPNQGNFLVTCERGATKANTNTPRIHRQINHFAKKHAQMRSSRKAAPKHIRAVSRHAHSPRKME